MNNFKEITELVAGDLLISPANKKAYLFLRKQEQEVRRFDPFDGFTRIDYYVLWDIREGQEIVVTEDSYGLYFGQKVVGSIVDSISGYLDYV